MKDVEALLLPGLQPSPPDARDKIASLPILSVLPVSVDLKPDVVEVENQLSFSSCTANAGCSALELMYNRKGTKYDFSRMFLYWYTRQLGNLSGDVGAYPRDIGKALNKYGVCYETTWQYNADDLVTAPSSVAITEAAPFKILSYEQLTGDFLQQIKNSVAQGIPVLLTMAVFDGFEKVHGTWAAHSWDTSTPVLGSHEVLVIGYDDVCKRLLIENSWGPTWGDGGFFGMPYEMVNNKELVQELWILNPNYDLQNVAPPPPPAPPAQDPMYQAIIAFMIVTLAVIFITQYMK